MAAATDMDRILTLAVWGGLGILALVIFTVAAHYLRKRLGVADSRPEDSSLDLFALRKLHEQGRISDDEYRSLRARAVEAVSGALTEEPPA